MSNDDIKATAKMMFEELTQTFPTIFYNTDVLGELLPKTKEGFKRLMNVVDDEEIINVTWCITDVEAQAENMGVSLTTEQKHDVMRYIEENHNAELGINWDVIGEVINIILRNNESFPRP
jgi:hypothetical protein